jgi:hypothetical protein
MQFSSLQLIIPVGNFRLLAFTVAEFAAGASMIRGNRSTRLVLRNLEIYTTLYHFVFSLIQLTTKTVNTARISSDKNWFLIDK